MPKRRAAVVEWLSDNEHGEWSMQLALGASKFFATEAHMLFVTDNSPGTSVGDVLKHLDSYTPRACNANDVVKAMDECMFEKDSKGNYYAKLKPAAPSLLERLALVKNEKAQSSPKAKAEPKAKRLTPAERAQKLGTNTSRLATGIETLDTATRGGILMRKVFAIGGAPGAGKTALAVQLAYKWLSEGVHVGFLAADEDADALLIRFGQLAGLSREALERGEAEAKAKLEAWCNSVPLILADVDEDETLEQVSRDLRDQAKGEPSVLVVDSIQTVRTEAPPTQGSDIRSRINVAVRALKHAAKVDGHLVVATSEISKAAYRNRAQAENISPLSAFKESGDIEYGVALALVLTSRPGNAELVDAVVAKNRLGQGRPEIVMKLCHTTAGVKETFDTGGEGEAAVRSAEIRTAITAVLAVRPIGSMDKLAAAIHVKKEHVRAEVQAMMTERLVVNLPGKGYCNDTPAARRARILAAVETPKTSTAEKLAKVACVDADEVNEMLRKGELYTSAGGFVAALRQDVS